MAIRNQPSLTTVGMSGFTAFLVELPDNDMPGIPDVQRHTGLSVDW
jgi:hypothetical protein